ncbi:MAG TPA: thiol:disulfide interchange protein DsbA/DsbL [Burkholderiales bacterium]|jgi:thiol:disulfide interchange protein DsbA
MQLNRRQFLGTLGAATAATAATLPVLQPAHAQSKPPVADQDYRVVTPAQPTDTAPKIEVIEFFWYACPHCYAFEPTLNPWIKRLPADVAFRRVPAQFAPIWVQHAKLFYALEALGEEERLHKKVFDTIHVDHKPLDSDQEQTAFAAANGIDKNKFTDALKSFGVAGKLKRAAQLVTNYGIDGVPTLTVNGKYLTSIVMTQSPTRTLEVMDYLINAERTKKKA